MKFVDGQQRTTAIHGFYAGSLRLSRTIESDDAAGKTYRELAPSLQDRFLTYPLAIDDFVNATEEEIREVFRRINSYVVPLNPEEQRHARWQGDFKWYIYRLSHMFDGQMSKVGIFMDRQLVRMRDMKLFAEVTHALKEGVMTTNVRLLNRIYEHNERQFDQAQKYTIWISSGLRRLFQLRRLWNTTLVRPYSAYSFLLAAIHAEHDLESLRPSLGFGAVEFATAEVVENRLLGVLDELEEKRTTGPYGTFVRAMMSQTNVKKQRVIRAQLFFDALRVDGGNTF